MITEEQIQQLVVYTIKHPKKGMQWAMAYGVWDAVKKHLLHKARINLCQHDINTFIEYVIVDPETDLNAKQQPFHREWQKLITERRRVLIVCSREHGKTVQLASRIVWEIGKRPNIRIKIIGSTDEKAKEILGMVAKMIRTNPRVKEVFPTLEMDATAGGGDTKTSFFVVRSNSTMRDPTCEAAGVLTAGAGGRADLLVCDDVCDMKNSVINPATREQVKKTVKDVWFSLVSAKTGRIVWIATPYHTADATHDVRDTPGKLWAIWWKATVTYERLFDEEGQPLMEDVRDAETGALVYDVTSGKPKQRQRVKPHYLWLEKWDADTLRDKEIELGPRSFARQFLLNAMSDDERTFKETDLVKSYDRDLLDIGDGVDANWPTFCGIDLASAMGKKAAWTVITTLAKNPGTKKLYIKHMCRRKMGFTETMERIVEGWDAQHWRFGYVENNGYQKAVEESLDKRFKEIPLAGFHTSAGGKVDEKVGLPGMSVAFSKGLFALPAARFPLPPEDTSELGALMSELQSHPGGEWSDCVMSLWFAYRAAIEGQGDFVEAYLQAMEET